MRILITGFEPFGGDPTNPSWPVAQRVAAALGSEWMPALLTCTFDTGMAQLRALIAEHRPDLVVCLGLAQGRAGLTIERVAINLIDARIPDNAGNQPIDVAVVEQGPSAYLSVLPLKRAVAASQAAQIPAAVSLSAGTFVCNAAFYTAAHALGPDRAAFIHIPLEAEAGGPLSVAQMATGVVAMVRELIIPGPDLGHTAGTLHS